MQYLTYEEYIGLGGILDVSAFNRNIDYACAVIDNATRRRVESMGKIPNKAKSLCRDLIEYFAENSIKSKQVASRNQSAGGVSESESYVTKSKEDLQADVDEIIFNYLANEIDDNGTPLLYRGCLR